MPYNETCVVFAVFGVGVVSLRAWFSLLFLALLAVSPAIAADAKNGFVIDVPVPLGSQSASELLGQLERLAKSAPPDGRLDVVLRYGDDKTGGQATSFEDALKVARAITGSRLRSIRVVSFVQGKVTGHSILPILASDAVLFSAAGQLIDASSGETGEDETISLSYQSIAARRGLFPKPIVEALIDPEVELAWGQQSRRRKSLRCRRRTRETP